MDIKQLRYFLATVDHRNMTRAADALHIAQPALSQQIAGLERFFGSKLLERSARGVQPTAAGEVLYRHAKGLLRQIDDLKGAISFERQYPSGRVALGVPSSTGRLLMIPLLEALREHPGILLEIVERPSSELVGLVAQGGLDLTIAIDAAPQRGLAIQPLYHEQLYLVLHPSAAPRRLSGITLEEVSRLPLLLPTPPNATRARFDIACLNANVQYHLAAETSATDLLIHAAQDGRFCTVLPGAAIHREIAEGRLLALPFEPQPLTREISLCTSADMLLSEASAVVRQLVLDILESLHRDGNWRGTEKIAAARR